MGGVNLGLAWGWWGVAGQLAIGRGCKAEHVPSNWYRANRVNCCAFSIGARPGSLLGSSPEPRQLKQDLVTWDEHSVFVRGERVFLFSGEVHPFRLPVPSLWLDVFQKIKALGFNCVSFYLDWALLEGKPGSFTAEGVFALEPFFEAAQTAGIWLIARPGPYINAEASGGGFPGWLQRVHGLLRSTSPRFLEATDNYIANVGAIIAKAQITNGGPVILYQPENEYYMNFPDGQYMEYVNQQARDAGIVVPLISNDAYPLGHNAPGTGPGEVDVYGHDAYPLGFNCAEPTVWPENGIPSEYHKNHVAQSPATPFSLLEFQGGSFDHWGGWGFDQCSALINHEFERVFFKNNYAAGVSIFNVYMTFGGTNWGNLGHPGGYTSYDYGSPIKEDRTVTREKYSELKLQATFIQSSPGILLTTPGSNTTTTYSSNPDITITPLFGNGTGSFFVVRHTNYSTLASTQYQVTLPSSKGDIHIPKANGSLTLNGRDSKIMVTDYNAAGKTLLYSTSDIFTRQILEDKKVLILYADVGEYNEFAIRVSSGKVKEIEKGAKYVVGPSASSGFLTIGWTASPKRTIISIGDLDVYLLHRNSAYNYWVTPTGNQTAPLIVNGPYLVRSASVDHGVVIGAPSDATTLLLNNKEFALEKTKGSVTAAVNLPNVTVDLPVLSDLDWKYLDNLPEIKEDYDDSLWTVADRTYTNNTYQALVNPLSLYAADYGYNGGVLVYRGHFNATGTENQLALWTQGGIAFASQVWLDGTLLGSWKGNGTANYFQEKYNFTETPEAGSSHVFTVLVDHMGHRQQSLGLDKMKEPRGVISWRLSTSKATTTPVSWKLTGNFGGEDYRDQVRGPLNEGGLFADRQGYHQPSPPTDQWASGSPLEGISNPGVAFYSAPFTLDLPSEEWDIPLSFSFKNDTSVSGVYRALLYVNGWQFGKLTSNIGPQTKFPVPEGILNYKGENWVGLSIWALEDGGARVPGLALTAGTPVWTGREPVELVDSPAWKEREGSY
ncbi:glycoside hydrolase family 35 protein [Zopfia rhizophila CBS 207.26]|uniref:Beta-galactosidase n=1 Tax=Zopfia rhizophila CBS 207.26 TaxID=1314779 RepID=A0A6A6E5V2_9PEZI|nr:glycoside hydrolase family 35 protein [Zopfia rhizophila CBS 207.26]